MRFIIFPTTLFEDIPKNITEIILIEEPTLIYDAKLRPLRVNKNKIALFRASLKAFHDSLKIRGIKTRYIPFSEAKRVALSYFKDSIAFDPCDDVITDKYKKYVTFIESPGFILSLQDVNSLEATRLSQVYQVCKHKLKLLENVKSQDEYNRLKLPLREISQIPDAPIYESKYHEEAINYANTFKQHVGDPRNIKYSPITHEEAKKHLDFFIAKRFEKFGPYQDATISSHVFMYHSNISHLLNNGLLTPLQVVAAIRVNKTPLPSYEGFVRQLIGWREYMRYLYVSKKSEILTPFKKTAPKLIAPQWRTGIYAIDNEIEKAISTGYAHHIVRLMFFLNYMKLAEIPPYAIYAWFMEVVSIDAYDWVMYSNIAAMGYYTKTPFMQKPYISTSSYISKMSDYKERDKVWDALFYRYLSRHKAELTGGAAVYLRNLATFEKWPKTKKDEIMSTLSDREAA